MGDGLSLNTNTYGQRMSLWHYREFKTDVVSNSVKGSNFTSSPCGCCGCGWWRAEKTMQAPTWHQSESNKCRARRARRARCTKHQFWCQKRLQTLQSRKRAANSHQQRLRPMQFSLQRFFCCPSKHSMHSLKRWVPVRLAQEQYNSGVSA